MTVAWGVIIHAMGTHNSESYGHDDAKTERYRVKCAGRSQ